MKKNIDKTPNIKSIARRKLYIYAINFRWYVKLFVPIIFILALVFSYGSIKRFIKTTLIENSADLGFRLNNIIIEGQQNINVNQIISKLSVEDNMPIFLLDLEEIKRIVKENDWVKNAWIMRKLPNTLIIKILERQPIAIWQYQKKLFLIDEDGFKINANVGKFTNLPHFVGQGADVYAYQLLKEIHPSILTEIKSIIRIGNRRWDLILNNGAIIKLPAKNIQIALDFLQQKYFNEPKITQAIKVLDMRDADKYYIERF